MSIRHHNLLGLLLGAFVTFSFGAGCQQESAPVTTAVPPAEESFEEIVQVLKDGLETPGGKSSSFVDTSAGSRTRFQVLNEITSKLIPPATADEPYRGVITISTQSVYSLRTSAENEKEDEKDKNQKSDRGSSFFDESAESGPGFSSFDESLITEAPDAAKPGGVEIDSVQRRADKVERNCELIYRNNRWELLTKFDPKTEASIENAFERALRRQP
jgi:hypothetical protein